MRANVVGGRKIAVHGRFIKDVFLTGYFWFDILNLFFFLVQRSVFIAKKNVIFFSVVTGMAALQTGFHFQPVSLGGDVGLIGVSVII